MEPTIYKPSIYKGAGIYKIGNGGGGGFNGIFELDIAALDLTKNRDVQNSTIIDLTNKENIEKIGNKLILKNAYLEVDLLQHVKDNTTKIKVEIKCNILNLADYGYIGSKFLTTFGSNYVFQNFGLVVNNTGISEFTTQLQHNSSWSEYTRYDSFTYNTSIIQNEEYIKGGISSLYVNNENICAGKYGDSTVFNDICKIQSQNINAIIELEKLKITWS